MPITVDKVSGAILIDGKESVDRYRLHVLRSGLKLEIKGLRMSRGRSCYAIIKGLGYKGSREKVLADFSAYLDSLPPPA